MSLVQARENAVLQMEVLQREFEQQAALVEHAQRILNDATRNLQEKERELREAYLAIHAIDQVTPRGRCGHEEGVSSGAFCRCWLPLAPFCIF